MNQSVPSLPFSNGVPHQWSPSWAKPHLYGSQATADSFGLGQNHQIAPLHLLKYHIQCNYHLVSPSSLSCHNKRSKALGGKYDKMKECSEIFNRMGRWS